jgi:phage terminase large subunit
LELTRLRVELPTKLLPLLTPNRYKVAYGGRYGLKSWSFARALVSLASGRKLRVLCARETQKSIDESVHYLLKSQIDRLGLSHLFDVQATKIIGVNGSEFVFAGIRQQGVANLKSFEDVDLCWVEEGQAVTKKSWDVLIPTIRKPGSEIWISFNTELDTDETYTRFVVDPPPGAFVVKMGFEDNPWITPEIEAERQLMLRRDPTGYRTVWGGEPRPAVEGAIYAQEIDQLQREGRFTQVRYDPLLRVHTVWDLGWNDQTVILLVQRAASELRLIGALIRRFTTYEDDITALNSLGYRWGIDYLPHDAKAKTKTSGGRSAEEIVKRLGRRVEIVEQDYIENGIKLARTIFPRLWVDRSCQDWLNSLKRYHRNVSADGSKTGIPVHDDASHGADALRYLAQVAEKLTNHSHNLGKLAYNNAGIV